MKNSTLPTLAILASFLTMSFQSPSITFAELVGTKWVAPINENCFESLCFTSENTVIYYRCDQNIYTELGYEIKDEQISIEAYSESDMKPSSQLLLELTSKILKQPASQKNRFPTHFIQVPHSVCQ